MMSLMIKKMKIQKRHQILLQIIKWKIMVKIKKILILKKVEIQRHKKVVVLVLGCKGIYIPLEVKGEETGVGFKFGNRAFGSTFPP